MHFIQLHLNNNFINKIHKKYNISKDDLFLLKYELKNKKISNNYYLAILCCELLPINIRLFKYQDINNIEIIYIKNKNVIDINIYNFNDLYELIISKLFINKIMSV